MDKQKEIEKIEFIIGSTIRECEQKDCIRNCEFARRKDCKYCRAAKDLVNSGYGDTKAAAKEAVTGFQSKLTKWLAKQYRESSTVEITAIFDKIEELLEETK
mgnify:FL=1